MKRLCRQGGSSRRLGRRRRARCALAIPQAQSRRARLDGECLCRRRKDDDRSPCTHCRSHLARRRIVIRLQRVARGERGAPICGPAQRSASSPTSRPRASRSRKARSHDPEQHLGLRCPQLAVHLVVFAMLAAFNAFNSPRARARAERPPSPSSVSLPGADPSDMEKLVIRPIEDVVNRLDDLKKIESRAEDGLAVIQVEFDWSTDPDKKYDDVVREITLRHGPRLDINKFRTSLTNIVQVALVSDTAPTACSKIWQALRRTHAWACAMRALPQSGARSTRLPTALALNPVTAVANAVGADARDFRAADPCRRAALQPEDGRRRDVSANQHGDRQLRQHHTGVRGPEGAGRRRRQPSRLVQRRTRRLRTATKRSPNIFKVRDGIFEVLDQFSACLRTSAERAFRSVDLGASRLGRLYLDLIALSASRCCRRSSRRHRRGLDPAIAA